MNAISEYAPVDEQGQSTNSPAVEFVARPTPIYLIGDSHGLIFNDLVFRENHILNETFITKTKYCPALAASNFTDEKGNLNQLFIQALISESLLDERGVPSHRSLSDNAKNVAVASQRSRKEPTIVVSCGDIDLRKVFIQQLGAQCDFTLPPNLAPLVAKLDAPENRKHVQYNLVLEFAKKLVKPLINGLQQLKKAGFSRLMLLGLAPPTTDDAQYLAMNKYPCPTLLRYKAAIVYNHVLRESANALGIHFIDTWNETTLNGVLNPKYHLDHVHLNKDAAFLAVDKMIQFITTKAGKGGYMVEQYQQAYQDAVTARSKSNIVLSEQHRQTFEKDSIVIFPGAMPADTVSQIRNGLNYDLDVGNRHYRLDWIGNTVEPFSDKVFTAKPGIDILKLVYDFLYKSPIYSELVSCFNYDFYIPTCRPVKSFPHQEEGTGPQKFHYDCAPPGTFRILIYLTDVDETRGPTAYQDKQTGAEHKALGGAGSVIAFDANALLHRGTPPVSDYREALDMVVYPRIGNSPQIVMNPGMNHWPVDPYIYSIDGYTVYPEIPGNQIVHKRLV